MSCRLKWEMETGPGVKCTQDSNMPEKKQGRDGAMGANERERNIAAALSDNPGGALVKTSRRNEWRKRRNQLLSLCHSGPTGLSVVVGRRRRVSS